MQCFVCEKDEKKRAAEENRRRSKEHAKALEIARIENEAQEVRNRLSEGWKPNFEEVQDEPYRNVHEMDFEADASHATQVKDLEQLLQKEQATQQVLQNAAAEMLRAEAENQLKDTKWTHEAKIVMYGWVKKLNPFRAPRGQAVEAWNRVAEEVKKSTQCLPKKEGRIEIGGHALQVFLGKQLRPDSKWASYKKQLHNEATLSGQAGFLTPHEIEEFGLLEEIDDMKKQVKADKDSCMGEKKLLQTIKDEQLNDEIYAACMATPAAKLHMLKKLNKQRKDITLKLEGMKAAGAKPEELEMKLTDQERKVLQLLARAKKESKSATSGTDANAEDSDVSDDCGRRGKRARLEDTMSSISKLGEKMHSAIQKPTDAEQAIAEFFRARAVSTQVQKPWRERLKNLDEALHQGDITKAEHAILRQRILNDAF
jgi:hypothetical protein